jgi:hypothetical protein
MDPDPDLVINWHKGYMMKKTARLEGGREGGVYIHIYIIVNSKH